MPDLDDIRWFKHNFAARILHASIGTPLTVDLVVAVACQETGFIWSRLRRAGLPAVRILELCVGDTIDARAGGRGRRAFPKNRADLLAHPQGAAMFPIARQALVDMAEYVPGFNAAVANPDKFCRGYGVFQRDLQFFREDPQYFLQRRYIRFEDTLAMCIAELKRGLRKLGFEQRSQLRDLELTHVAIAYNTGGFKRSKGLKQGHYDGHRFYGERIFEFIRLSKTVATGEQPSVSQALPPSLIAVTGPFFRVDTRSTSLRLRSEPRRSTPSSANVKALLPNGHSVRAVTGMPVDGFMEIETRLMDAMLRGFAASEFLTPVDELDNDAKQPRHTRRNS